MFKDTTITAADKKREIIVLLACFLVAFLLNVVAIFLYKTEWNELYTMLHVVVLLALGIYLLSWIVRGGYWGVKSLVSMRRKLPNR